MLICFLPVYIGIASRVIHSQVVSWNISLFTPGNNMHVKYIFCHHLWSVFIKCRVSDFMASCIMHNTIITAYWRCFVKSVYEKPTWNHFGKLTFPVLWLAVVHALQIYFKRHFGHFLMWIINMHAVLISYQCCFYLILIKKLHGFFCTFKSLFLMLQGIVNELVRKIKWL